MQTERHTLLDRECVVKHGALVTTSPRESMPPIDSRRSCYDIMMWSALNVDRISTPKMLGAPS